jgi:hypothetical protein
MEWLLYLMCPLMMLFCMKGLFSGGKKDCHTKENHLNEMNELKKQVSSLTEQNQKLSEEVKSLHLSNTRN